MDEKLAALRRQLQADPNLELRQQYTRAAIRAGVGHLVVWRGGIGAPPDTDYIEIEQPLFPVSGPLISDHPVGQKIPDIKQRFQCYAVTDLDDLAELLRLQPTGLIRLSDRYYQAFRSNIPKQPPSKRHFWRPLYDTNTVRPSGTGQLSFFQVPLGGQCIDGYIKTQVDTNMDQGGSLPPPAGFFITGISAIIDPETPYTDAMTLITNTWFRLFIGCYDYLVGPANWITLAPLNVIKQGAKQNSLLALRLSDPLEPVMALEEPIELIYNQNFRVELNLPLPQVFSQPIRIQVILHGFFHRKDYVLAGTTC